MRHLGTYENTSSNTTKEAKTGKQIITLNKQLKIDKFTYIYYRMNNVNDSNDNSNQ